MTTDITEVGNKFPASSQETVEAVRRIENVVSRLDQVKMRTAHTLHAGVYTRTVLIPKDVVLTTALIKIPTTVIISGACSVLMGDGEERSIVGYHVIAASKNRIQAYVTHMPTHVTMLFKTDARTVEDAEKEFTDEHENLMSRKGVNEVVITGD